VATSFELRRCRCSGTVRRRKSDSANDASSNPAELSHYTVIQRRGVKFLKLPIHAAQRNEARRVPQRKLHSTGLQHTSWIWFSGMSCVRSVADIGDQIGAGNGCERVVFETGK